ncbi:toxin of the YoeB-YefM toxin-antitoxin system [uncultured spirochete]|jgi:toxin YoeB|uniref:Putative mRNA interferase YoeB n=1 Tax=uncultured spirochete TaxID=156406 RepID=A0A3P3XJM5_9SPIR|nr:Txe/YoeB family addiction module toxin [Rectinema subterraneum]SLM13808.1 toxin of the YoeB-YefM toxin-antitoxin system [uncultured spirochete]
MKLLFSEHAWEDYLFWQNSDPTMLQRINQLILEIQRTPFSGKGKPEPLKFALKGYWSRRITEEHRIIYKVVEDTVFIAQLRYHY